MSVMPSIDCWQVAGIASIACWLVAVMASIAFCWWQSWHLAPSAGGSQGIYYLLAGGSHGIYCLLAGGSHGICCLLGGGSLGIYCLLAGGSHGIYCLLAGGSRGIYCPLTGGRLTGHGYTVMSSMNPSSPPNWRWIRLCNVIIIIAFTIEVRELSIAGIMIGIWLITVILWEKQYNNDKEFFSFWFDNEDKVLKN